MVKQNTKNTKGCVISETEDKIIMYHNADNRIIYIRSKNPKHNIWYKDAEQPDQVSKLFSITNLRNYLAGFLVAGLILSFGYLVLRGLGVINGW